MISALLYYQLNQEVAAYEIPREEVFDIAGLYVPTAVSYCIQWNL